MSAKFTDSLFKLEQSENAYPDGMERHYWHLGRNDVILRTLKAWTSFGDRALDYGCGRGFAVSFLRQNGIECFGIEPSGAEPIRSAAAYVIRENKPEASLKLDPNSVRTILLLDVLEHVSEPLGLLNEVLSQFPQTKTVIITVPARTELFSSFDEYYNHCLRYVPSGLKEISEKFGWDLVSNRYFFRLLYFPMLIAAKLRLSRKVELKGPTGLSVFFHWIMGKLLIAESLVLPSGIPGSSLIAVLKKPPR